MSEIKGRKEGARPDGGEKIDFMRVNSSSSVLRQVKKFRESTGT